MAKTPIDSDIKRDKKHSYVWDTCPKCRPGMKLDCQIEDLEEIDRLMRRRPRYLKEVSFAH